MMMRVYAILGVVITLVLHSFPAAASEGSDGFARAAGFQNWSEFQRSYPGATTAEVKLAGPDIRIILSRIIPDFDKYFQVLIDQLDSLDITSDKGRTLVDATLVANSMTFSVDEHAKRGRLYAVRLNHRVHLEVSMHADNLRVDHIRGFTIYAHMPVGPDGIYPRRVELNTDTEKLSIEARFAGGFLRVVAAADVRDRKFIGIDWWASLMRNLLFWRDA